MFHNMDDVRAANQARGSHWFSDRTMEFFRSRIETELINGRWFVTSEEYPADDMGRAERRFTIREASDSGGITTIGEFMEYATLTDAVVAIHETVLPAETTAMDRLTMLP